MSYYSVQKLEGMAEVRVLLADGANALNWLFLSTSGVHGSYQTLDNLFKVDEEYPGEEEIPDSITAIVFQPRTVRVWYGDIKVTPEDVPWLREQVTKTLTAVATSQLGNVVVPERW